MKEPRKLFTFKKAMYWSSDVSKIDICKCVCIIQVLRLLTFCAALEGPLFLLPLGRPLGRLGTGSPLGSWKGGGDMTWVSDRKQSFGPPTPSAPFGHCFMGQDQCVCGQPLFIIQSDSPLSRCTFCQQYFYYPNNLTLVVHVFMFQHVSYILITVHRSSCCVSERVLFLSPAASMDVILVWGFGGNVTHQWIINTFTETCSKASVSMAPLIQLTAQLHSSPYFSFYSCCQLRIISQSQDWKQTHSSSWGQTYSLFTLSTAEGWKKTVLSAFLYR